MRVYYQSLKLKYYYFELLKELLFSKFIYVIYIFHSANLNYFIHKDNNKYKLKNFEIIKWIIIYLLVKLHRFIKKFGLSSRILNPK